jgi:hypothetical protein
MAVVRTTPPTQVACGWPVPVPGETHPPSTDGDHAAVKSSRSAQVGPELGVHDQGGEPSRLALGEQVAGAWDDDEL